MEGGKENETESGRRGARNDWSDWLTELVADWMMKQWGKTPLILRARINVHRIGCAWHFPGKAERAGELLNCWIYWRPSGCDRLVQFHWNRSLASYLSWKPGFAPYHKRPSWEQFRLSRCLVSILFSPFFFLSFFSFFSLQSVCFLFRLCIDIEATKDTTEEWDN